MAALREQYHDTHRYPAAAAARVAPDQRRRPACAAARNAAVGVVADFFRATAGSAASQAARERPMPFTLMPLALCHYAREFHAPLLRFLHFFSYCLRAASFSFFIFPPAHAIIFATAFAAIRMPASARLRQRCYSHFIFSSSPFFAFASMLPPHSS